jgi:hypothetical protein
MARLRSKRQRRQCLGKVLYTTAVAAWAAAGALHRDGRPLAYAYKCAGRFGQPRHWHVSSGRRKRL